MILVTSAAGKTGKAVIRSLSDRGEDLRLLVHRPEQASDFRRAGATDIVAANLSSPADMAQAMKGVRAVYFIVPNTHPEEVRLGEIAIESARSAGVERFVFHSVLHPQVREMPHHWQKLVVEERLLESGLSFTILQPAPYMQNVLPFWDTIVSEGAYRVPYGEGAALSMVDLEDIAEVAAKVLTDPTHESAIYELAGPEALTPAALVRILSESLERPVQSERVPIPEWETEARARGLGEYALHALVRMFHYYDRNGLRGNPRVLESLLGREPANFSEFAARFLRSG